MLTLKKIAITGGVASGKSTVCQFLEEKGAFVVRADAVVHDLLENNADLRTHVIQLLGPKVLEHGKINRNWIAQQVFSSKKLLKALEALVHPLVFRRLEELYAAACRANQYTLFVVEIPLVFETNTEAFYDAVVAVIADPAIAERRSPFAYAARMQHQLSPVEKARRAHHTLINNGSLEELQKQVTILHQNLQNPK